MAQSGSLVADTSALLYLESFGKETILEAVHKSLNTTYWGFTTVTSTTAGHTEHSSYFWKQMFLQKKKNTHRNKKNTKKQKPFVTGSAS